MLVAFGSVLRALRDGRELSTGQVEQALTKAGARLGRSTLTQYEQGTVRSPDPVILEELAIIYRCDLQGLIAALKANRQNPDLTVEQADAIRKGASDARTVEARVLLEERDSARSALSEMRELAAQIVAIAAEQAGRIGQKTRRGESFGGRHRRSPNR